MNEAISGSSSASNSRNATHISRSGSLRSRQSDNKRAARRVGPLQREASAVRLGDRPGNSKAEAGARPVSASGTPRRGVAALEKSLEHACLIFRQNAFAG